MRDGDDGATLHQTFQRFHDEFLRLGVERGGGFVEDEDGGVPHHGAGNADALALPAGKRQAALADRRVVAVGHLRDEVVRVGHLRRFDDLRRRRFRPSIGDVVADRAGEEDGILQDEANLRTQQVKLQVGDIHAIDPHTPQRRIVKARDEAQHGGLPAAGWAADSDALAGFDGEVDVAQHGGFRIVGEGHMLQHDLALEPARIARVRLLRNDRVGVENRLDTFQADRCLRDDIGHFREVLHRVEELIEVGEKHRQRANGHRVAQNQSRPAPEHKSHAKRDGHRDNRGEQRLDAPRLQGRLHRLHARVLEARFLHILPAERLDRAHGFQALLHDGDDVALALAHLVRGVLHGFLETRDEEQQEGGDAHRDQRKVEIQVEHHADHTEDGQRIDEDAE